MVALQSSNLQTESFNLRHERRDLCLKLFEACLLVLLSAVAPG